MTDITTWFQLGTVGMLLGTLAMGWAARSVPEERREESYLLILVGLTAAVAYGLMSVGIGTIQAADGHTIYLARYIDWMLTTPMHVVFLGLLAGSSVACLTRLAVAQAGTIVLGLIGAYLTGALSAVFFIAGSLLFGYVLYVLYGEVTDSVQGAADTIVGLHRKLLNFIAVLWLIYPIIWVLAPAGFGIVDLETQSLVVSYIDVVAKVGFGLIALNGMAIASYLESESDTPDTPGAGAAAGD